MGSTYSVPTQNEIDKKLAVLSAVQSGEIPLSALKDYKKAESESDKEISASAYQNALAAYQNKISSYAPAKINTGDIRTSQVSKASNTQLGAASQATAAQIASQDETRAKQMSYLSQLENQMTGKTPSVANLQLQQTTDANLKQALAASAAQRGVGAGSAARAIAQNQAATQQTAAGQAATLRAQEQANLTSQYGTVVQNARASDYESALAQAQLNQQAGLSNQSALNQFALQQGTLNQQTSLANQAATNQANLLQTQQLQEARLANQAATNQANQTQLSALSNVAQQQAQQQQLVYGYDQLAQQQGQYDQNWWSNLGSSVLSGIGSVIPFL